ncbi:aminotransferase class III-fold pyridoxal phosphate-dependent enzyme [Parahaliea mediterranea]|uniref:Aminotransferase class III-fold pyridoxal phosphate-dependent enzyme n=1 Tax=Parahaliea mediterranea TaxID=651086 RepID=A0A939DIK7_9GAMM|nr:aminotransferase class III-fold pyridoxal phosphate-dependent enzyme [Parahaliea mediterranea]MBN7798132.1 aminotransferase class III-fold pyridoxal phosphate-dependent enzyme [Parahaliea mediterranea]
MSDFNLDNWWQPFTNVRAFRDNPRIFTRAEGSFLYKEDGQEVLDITAGLWCCNIGHGRREVADAVHKQLMELDYAPPFQFGTPPAFQFAERIAGHLPEGINRVFFTNSGSEAVDTALKIAHLYQFARGKGGKSRFISREQGYHGVNVGGTSVQGLPNNRHGFPLLQEVDFLPGMLDIARNAFSRGCPEHGTERMAQAFEQIVAMRGADSICALIIEPVSGAGGMVPPPVGYLQKARELCDQHDILLIFDEVITGFGRTGSAFAATEFGVTPDIMTSAKAINGGTVPMGGVFVKDEIQQAIFDSAPAGVPEFFHGNTYAGTPVAAAAGLASMDIYEREGLFTCAGGAKGEHWADTLHAMRDLPQVIDVRNYGLLGAVSFDSGDLPAKSLGPKIHQRCYDNGVLCRAVGDHMVMSPPLSISEGEIDLFAERFRKSVNEVLG